MAKLLHFRIDVFQSGHATGGVIDLYISIVVIAFFRNLSSAHNALTVPHAHLAIDIHLRDIGGNFRIHEVVGPDLGLRIKESPKIMITHLLRTRCQLARAHRRGIICFNQFLSSAFGPSSVTRGILFISGTELHDGLSLSTRAGKNCRL